MSNLSAIVKCQVTEAAEAEPLVESGIPLIESGIPLPETQAARARIKKEKDAAILKNMNIGQSTFFAWTDGPGDVARLRNRLLARIRYALPAKFAVRNWPIEKPSGFRVWRVS